MKTIAWGSDKNILGRGPQQLSPSQDLVQKARKGMSDLLTFRLHKGLPLRVMRPLMYSTSVMDTQREEEDDGFYLVRKSESLGKFIDVNVTIPVGTELLLKSLDPGMQEFIFIESGSKKEHAISYEAQSILMSQTDIFETVQNFLATNVTA